MAREYGFAAWSEVDGLADQRPDAPFETAVDALISGDIDALSGLLGVAPELVRDRSAYGHSATLLHYVAANGVETYRQQTPNPVADIAALLIQRGADVNATALMYGGSPTTYALVMTSAHPRAAGAQERLARVLRDAGANVEPWQ